MSVWLLVFLYLWEVRQSGNWSPVANGLSPAEAALVVAPRVRPTSERSLARVQPLRDAYISYSYSGFDGRRLGRCHVPKSSQLSGHGLDGPVHVGPVGIDGALYDGLGSR